MRLVLAALGRVLLDLRILEDDDEEPEPGAGATVQLCEDDPPFGFRPTPDPWPPSWE